MPNITRLADVVSNSSKKISQISQPTYIVDLENIESRTGKLLQITKTNTIGSTKNQFNSGDVLYGKLRPYLKKFAFPKFEGVCTSEIWVLSSTSSALTNAFLYYLIQTKAFENLAAQVSGTKMPRADWKVVSQLKFDLPSLPEQEKIAGFLSALDDRIDLQSKKIDLLIEQKKGYSQKIFSRELVFKDDNGNSYGEWKTKRIDSISSFSMGFTPDTKNSSFWEGSNDWLSIAGMGEKYITTGNKFISDEAIQGKKPSFFAGTLIMSFKLSIGKLAILKKNLHTNEAICGFTFTDEVQTEYMYYALSNIDIASFGSRAIKGITLNSDNIGSIVVPIPSLQEQSKISDFLSSLDLQIEIEQEKLKLLNQQKQGYMQRIFA